MKHLRFVAFLLLLNLHSFSQRAHIGDSLEVVKLYHSTGGAGWNKKDGWLTNTPLASWYGISMSPIHVDSISRVVGIFLANNNLTGPLPNFGLPNLVDFFLDGNQITGPLPNFNIPSIVNLNFANNQLTGPLPNFNFPNLVSLNLSRNQLTGPLPELDLPNLVSLDISYNQIFGSVPNYDFPKIANLWINNNKLSYDQDFFDKYPWMFACWFRNPNHPPVRESELRISGDTLSFSAGPISAKYGYTWQVQSGYMMAAYNRWYFTDIDTTVDGKYPSFPYSGNVRVVVRNDDPCETLVSTLKPYSNYKLLNPFTSLNGSYHIINPTFEGIDSLKIFNGVAADGVSKLLIYTKATSSVTFKLNSSKDGSLAGANIDYYWHESEWDYEPSYYYTSYNYHMDSIELWPDNLEGGCEECRVVAVYTAPDGIGSTENNATERTVFVEATIVGLDNTIQIPIKIVTPPV